MARPELLTKDRFYRSCVIWQIHNYSKSTVPVNTAIECPEFVTNLRQRIRWKITFFPRREVGGHHVTECIIRRSPYCKVKSTIEVKFGLSIIDSRGNSLSDNNRYFCFNKLETVTFSTLDIHDSRRNVDESTCFFNGNIKIIFSFIQEPPRRYHLIDIDEDLWSLASDLKNFYHGGEFTDLDLKVGEETFHVHSLIVKARSPKIRRMLNGNSSLREIDLSDFCSVTDLKNLILYWYSGELGELPKIPTFSSAALIRNMEQLEIAPYCDPEYVKLNTIFKTSKRHISWVIRDIPFCGRLRHLERAEYYLYKCENLPWKLHIYPRGIRGDANSFTMIIIDNGPFKTTDLELFLRDKDDKEYFCTPKTVQSYNSRIYTFCKFMTHNDFARLSEILLKGNTLRIGCRMTYATGYIEQNCGKFCFTEDFPLNREHPFIRFANDMKRIHKDADEPDFCLKSGNRTFKVHLRILAARSGYFASLLRMVEEESYESDTITLDDVEPDDLDKILKSVYYGKKIILNSDFALRLYPVFWNYGMLSLKSLCSDFLRNNLSVNNALNIVELAYKFRKEDLEYIALYFVKDNWYQISRTEAWTRLQNTNEKLASDIITFIGYNTYVNIDSD